MGWNKLRRLSTKYEVTSKVLYKIQMEVHAWTNKLIVNLYLYFHASPFMTKRLSNKIINSVSQEIKLSFSLSSPLSLSCVVMYCLPSFSWAATVFTAFTAAFYTVEPRSYQQRDKSLQCHVILSSSHRSIISLFNWYTFPPQCLEKCL